jgi:general secretion pathway protein E
MNEGVLRTPKNKLVDLSYFSDEQDSYGVYRFSDHNINSIIENFTGLDQKVFDYLTSTNSISEQNIRQICMEMIATGKGFTELAIKHGVLRQSDIIELNVSEHGFELLPSEQIEPAIPFKFIKEFHVKIHTITSKKIYYSTLSSPTLVEAGLKEYLPRLKPCQIPHNPISILDYLQKVEKYTQTEGALLDVIIRKAIREKVSDIHIIPDKEGYNMKFRRLGVLEVERVGSEMECEQLITKIKIISGLDYANRTTPQDGRFDTDYNGKTINFRVATCPTVGNKETVTIRLLDPENAQIKFDDLGITMSKEVKDAVNTPNGVFLVCGTTGSGKSTTITSMLRWVIDRYSIAISAVEDPVENELNNIKQTQVDQKRKLTFSNVLRSYLRQDPDVIVVGEIRDEETAQIAFAAAETGHRIIASLHIKDIRGVVSRLLSMGVEKYHVVEQLRGVLVQKLMRTICQVCFGENSECDHCYGKKYVSRTMVSEVFQIKDMEDLDVLLDYKKPIKWTTIIEDAFSKYEKRITDREEMIRVFGTDFFDEEKKQAENKAKLVKKGFYAKEQFIRLFPEHTDLIKE